MKRYAPIVLWILIVVAVLHVAGCQTVPSPLTPTATGEDSPLSPAAAYSMPDLDLPPAVVEFSPKFGQELAPEAVVVRVRFDQEMDRASVEAAWRVSPEVRGEFRWQNERAFTYRPQGLSVGTRYQVSLDTGARSVEGRALGQPLAFSFSTLGPLKVTQVSPSASGEEVRVDAPVLISFNRPVVPANCANAVAGKTDLCPALPLTTLPAINGEGFWVSSSVYRFTPRLGWDAGRTYQLEVAAGVGSVSGAELAVPYAWSFQTAAPRVEATEPADREQDVLLEQEIVVRFNTPMDPEATGNAFALVTETGEPLPGRLMWEDNGAVLVFTPTRGLELETRYVVRVGERARALTGAPLELPLEFSFDTVPYPSVSAITPADGVGAIGLYEPVRIRLQGAISPTSLLPHLNLTPAVAESQLYNYWDGGVWHLAFEKEPRTEYCVALSPGVVDLYGNAMEEEVESCFTTGDLPAAFAPATGSEAITLDAGEPAQLYVVTRNLDSIPLQLLQLAERDFVSTQAAAGITLRGWTERLGGAPNEAAFVPVNLAARGGALQPGYYALTWNAPENATWRRELRIAVVDRHLTLKVATEEALVWVTELSSGAPITGTEVRLFDERATLVAAGTTDSDGVARIPLEPRESLWERLTAVTGQPGGAGFGVAMTFWDLGASIWDFSIAPDYGAAPGHNLYLYSDRPLYRPGQQVHVRGVLREERDVRYTLPDLEQQVELRLHDGEWNRVITRSVSLSELGSFEATFELAEDAELGRYTVEAQLVGRERVWMLPFDVAAYRKPEFEVTLLPEQEAVLQEETLRILVEATYYFGGGVSHAPVTWEVHAQPTSFAPGVEGMWHWGAEELRVRDETPLIRGTATTGADGKVLLEIPTELLRDAQGQVGPEAWVIEVAVVDESGFAVSARASTTVHPARFYLGLRLRDWVVTAGERTTVDIRALDWQGAPVAGQEVEIQLAQREWYQEPAARPFAEPSWHYTDTIVSTLNVTTDRAGAAEAVVTPPRGGPYVILAASSDVGELPVGSQASLWVSGRETAAWRAAEAKIMPVPDAESYRPGDVASILLPSPFEGPYHVLMTVERGSILQVRHFVAQEASPLVELPIETRHAPNVYVSFVLVKGATEDAPPDVRLGYVNLRVEPVAQTLSVQIEASGALDNYRPGDAVSLTVRTLDAAGRTVDAEVGLMVVDKAVLALREDPAPGIREGFYGERRLGVVTGDSLLVLFNRIAAEVVELQAEAGRIVEELAFGVPGMGGGGGSGFPSEVRQTFPDTALWETRLRTGTGGMTSMTFELPDSLTTWVVDARAVTADTKVGQATTELVVTQPLLLRPITPRFFVAGDRPEVAAVVHNTTPEDLEITVGLETLGVLVEGDVLQRIALPAGERTRVVWPLSVPLAGADAALLTFSVEGGGYRDVTRPLMGRAPDGALPIYRFELPDTVGLSGVLESEESRLEAIVIPPDAGRATQLSLQLETSLAAHLLSELTYLESVPASTTEQIVSRLLPNVLTYRALTGLAVDAPALEEQLTLAVHDGLDRLYARQQETGGWGWSTGAADLQVSAYVGLALIEAREAGFEVREDVLRTTLNYLAERLALELQQEGRTWRREHALSLYILTRGREMWPSGVSTALYSARDTLGATGKAYLLLALGGADDSDRRVRTLLDELRGTAILSPAGAQWEDASAQSWTTDVRATAVVLKALIELEPDDPLIPQAARWLLTARHADRLTSTQEVVWTLLALTDLMLETGELYPNYAWGLAFNAVPLVEDRAGPEGLLENTQITLGLSDNPAEGMVRGTTNALEITRGGGQGPLYYRGQLALFYSAEGVEAEARGILVEREYCALPELPAEAAACVPVASLRVGEQLEVRLTVIVPETRFYVALEDFFAAGLEPVETVSLTEPQVSPASASSGRSGTQDPFEHRELRDERARFLVPALPAGTYEVRYRLRAVVPGEYRVLPARAWESYFPEVWGRSAADSLRILP